MWNTLIYSTGKTTYREMGLVLREVLFGLKPKDAWGLSHSEHTACFTWPVCLPRKCLSLFKTQFINLLFHMCFKHQLFTRYCTTDIEENRCQEWWWLVFLHHVNQDRLQSIFQGRKLSAPPPNPLVMLLPHSVHQNVFLVLLQIHITFLHATVSLKQRLANFFCLPVISYLLN